MKSKTYLFLVLSLLVYNVQSQVGRLALSPFQESKIKIGTTDIAITYSRPSMRGRELFGGLVPFNEWWRTGANSNTTIEFGEDVIINKQQVKKGKYAIFSKPTHKEWKIIFYKDTSNWDVPTDIDTSKIAATIVVGTHQLSIPLEVLSISVGDFTNYKFDVNIAWDRTEVTIPIELTTEKIMEKKIEKTLNGPNSDDYYSAARYEMESGKNYERGLKWIGTTIEMREKPSWWDLRIKAILLMELKRNKEAITVAEKGLMMAEKEKREYGINEFKRVLKQLSE